MKLEAKVKNAFIDGAEDAITKVQVDADFVDSDEDEVRAYIIDELETKRPGQVNYEFEVTNMSCLLEDLDMQAFRDKTSKDHPSGPDKEGKMAGDSGIIYCPYIPLQLQKIVQPGTFTPSVGARTRYGLMSSPWDARNFYHFMKVTGVSATTVDAIAPACSAQIVSSS